MALDSGSRIGPYEITGKLGAGGMGEVYRASDSKLRRDVAIKVLPDGVAQDPERLARFEREAQLLAALNHPNIAGIHGLEEADGNRCLILELVEGRTLGEMIEAGAIPLETSVRFALQIAEALEAAHDKGIIHRDLKPANVKVTPDGIVKVLDFGLAKAFNEDGAESSADLAHSPTLTMAATQAGVIMGTAGYMSPEQAAGQPADRRSDIWSFGVVLYEMLTGRQSFSGETVSHTLAAVLKDDPEWDRLPQDLPPRLLELLESCLRKKSRDRLQAIGDARIVLEAWLADPSAFDTPAVSETPVQAPARASRTPWWVAGALAAALVTTLVLLWPQAPTPEPPVRAALPLPDGQPVFRGYASSVILSPDGTRLAYIAELPRQERGLFVRGLDQSDGIQLGGDKPAYNPFFSPDGNWLGFVTREAMYKVPVRGGSPIKLADVALNRGASWGDDGSIVFAPTPTSGLFRVSQAGGQPEPLTEVGKLGTHRWPQVLPGSEAVLFTAKDDTSIGSFDDARIEVLLLDSGERRVVHEGGTYGRYLASGHVVFAAGSSLFAAPFDLDSLTVTGAIVPVLDDVSVSDNQGGAQFDVSPTGHLVYASDEGAGAGLQLVRVDRTGTVTPLVEELRNFGNPALSPDGRRLALNINDEGKDDVWIYDLDRALSTRITAGVGNHWGPVWSPDGRWIYYAVTADSNRIERIAADGSGRPEVIVESDRIVTPRSVSPDGRRLMYLEGGLSAPDIYSFWIDRGESEPFLAKPGVEYDAQFSPDGRWIAYGSDESGSFEVYVVPADGGRGRWQISNDGSYPRWSADGKSLFYRTNSNGQLYEVPLVLGEGTLRAERPRQLLEGSSFFFDAGPTNHYAVEGDGQSFLLMQAEQDRTAVHDHVNLVLNWADTLSAILDGN